MEEQILENLENSNQEQEQQKSTAGKKVTEYEDFYIIKNNDDLILFTKEDEKKFREMYCPSTNGVYITLAGCARELGMTLEEIKACKRALNITHDSSEFTKEELNGYDVDELSERALQKKDKRLEEKIRQKEYKKAIKQNKKFRQKDYFLDKKTEKIIKKMDKIDWRPPYFYEPRIEDPKNNSLVVNISDWHKGKLIINDEILADNEYNFMEYQKRKKMFLEDVIEFIEIFNPEKIYILNYGDGPDGPIPDVYEGQENNQDIMHEEQLVGYAVDIKNFILGIYDYQPNIYYSSVPGNHSKANFNWDYVANRVVESMLADYEEIEFNVQKSPFKVNEIYNYYLIQVHGNQLSSRMSTPTAQKEALGVLNLKDLPPKRTYICQGHLHHRASEGPSYRRIMLPSMCGNDDLSSNKMQTGSRSAQTIFVFKEGSGLKTESYTFFD